LPISDAPCTVPVTIVAFQHTVYPQHRLVFSVSEGYLTATAIRDHAQRLAVDPDFDATFDHLADYTGVTDWQISPNQMHELASIELFSDTSRRALIAVDKHTYGMLRMYQGYLSRGFDQVHVFETREQALTWLGHPTDLPLQIV
jgi:hypothetical protein